MKCLKVLLTMMMLIAIAPCQAQGLSQQAAGIRMDTVFHTGKKMTHPSPTWRSYMIPQDQYTRCLGFFCRQELHLQQAHIPVIFRLGSVDECNRLEEKNVVAQ